jgi:hypothetical protein
MSISASHPGRLDVKRIEELAAIRFPCGGKILPY